MQWKRTYSQTPRCSFPRALLIWFPCNSFVWFNIATCLAFYWCESSLQDPFAAPLFHMILLYPVFSMLQCFVCCSVSIHLYLHIANSWYAKFYVQLTGTEDEYERESKIAHGWYPEDVYEGEDGQLTWFNAGVRVGVGIGLGMCLGVGIGVGLLMRSYQATTRNFRRRFFWCCCLHECLIWGRLDARTKKKYIAIPGRFDVDDDDKAGETQFTFDRVSSADEDWKMDEISVALIIWGKWESCSVLPSLPMKERYAALGWSVGGVSHPIWFSEKCQKSPMPQKCLCRMFWVHNSTSQC